MLNRMMKVLQLLYVIAFFGLLYWATRNILMNSLNLKVYAIGSGGALRLFAGLVLNTEYFWYQEDGGYVFTVYLIFHRGYVG